MADIIVTAPVFFSGSTWMDASTVIEVGGSVLLDGVEENTNYHAVVAQYDSKASESEIKKLISEGMKAAHAEAQNGMAERYGPDWSRAHTYRIGALEYHELDYSGHPEE
jgi:hypothetical protein